MDLTDDESQLMPRPQSMPAMYKLGSSSKEEKAATPTFITTTPDLATDGGSHSSEEELEEINNIPISFTTPPATPVEFSTTPPNHVHKPRRSTSPPLVHHHSNKSSEDATPLLSSNVGVALPCQERSQQEALRSERRAIASKKRYKQSRIHHIQRPCLDFEKMQLVSLEKQKHFKDIL